ncbi:hypothetical protein EB155_05995 [archaeon]|nr:hypothetical protein [archaeon]NDB55501.1 hypothetical protein [archaeon]NDB79401.1 hypothetical protein [archaeon]
MEVMMEIYNRSEDYNVAKENKYVVIREFLADKKSDIEHIIFIYGIERAMTEFKAYCNSDVGNMLFNLAVMIFGNIICLYEIHEEEVALNDANYKREEIMPYQNILPVKRERSDSLDYELDLNRSSRDSYNKITGSMISENSNY